MKAMTQDNPHGHVEATFLSEESAHPVMDDMIT